jgi:CRISPR-associated protein Cmr1
MSNTLTATFQIVTPMFIGGADQSPQDGVRPPSIKGALRFWWRALNWGRYLREAQNEAAALHLLHQQEARLFGIAANGAGTGQGQFMLRISRQPRLNLETQWPTNNTSSGYLGFGLMENNQDSHRQGIREGVDFELELRFKPKSNANDIAALEDVLQVWSLFGGLGSRARRGFGSITLKQLDGQDMMLNQIRFETAARERLNKMATAIEFPPYTAFSQHASFSILAIENDARRVHSQAGLHYKSHRGQESHLRGGDKIPFGLPLQGVDQESRRASPLFFHIHALNNNQYAAAVLYLPAHFHHDSRYQTIDLVKFNHDVARFVSTTESNP